MELLDFICSIIVYGSSDVVGNKKISPRTRKRILIVFVIGSLCYIGIAAFCILRAIKEKSIIILILGIIVFILFLYNVFKTVERYKESQQMNKEKIRDFFNFIFRLIISTFLCSELAILARADIGSP